MNLIPPGSPVLSLLEIGKVRESQQDCIGCSPGGSLLAIADGMGGSDGGAEASLLAVQTVLRGYEKTRNRKGTRDYGHTMAGFVMDAHKAVCIANARTGRRGGTTLTIARLLPGCVWLGHVGDTRCYAIGQGIRLLTMDHNLGGHGQNVLLQAIGHGDITPDVTRWDVAPGDRVVLVSDGITKHLDDQGLRMAFSLRDPIATIRRAILTTEATDNFSVVAANAR